MLPDCFKSFFADSGAVKTGIADIKMLKLDENHIAGNGRN
jgi:hypothetical protein